MGSPMIGVGGMAEDVGSGQGNVNCYEMCVGYRIYRTW